jgi:UDP-glucose 4-epimerase
MKNKTICVTGGSGFIASHLIKALKKENPKQIINLDLKTGYNLTQYRELEVFFEQNKVDIVYDLATLPLPISLKQPYKVTADIVTMILNLCELQRLGMFGRLVHISSSEAYGNATTNAMDEKHNLKPRTPYAAGKASGDLIALAYVETFKNDIIIPRSYNAYGPGQPLNWGAVIPKTINRILNGEHPVIFKDGTQTRDFVFVKDIAKGIIEVSKIPQSGIVVNIGTGIETPINELVKQICKLMDYKGEIDYIEQRAADVSRHRADNSELKRLTGYTPTTLLTEGLLETINYYVNLHPVKAVRS